MSVTDLPTIRVDPSTQARIWSDEERRAAEGGAVDPFDWFLAVGRTLRARDPALRREAKRCCAAILVPEPRVTPTDVAYVAESALQRVEMLSRGLADLFEGQTVCATELVLMRDDLESVLSALGLAVLEAPDESQALARNRLAEAERTILQELTLVDDTAFEALDSLHDALDSEVDRSPLDRILALGVDRTAGWWMDVVAGPRTPAVPLEFKPPRAQPHPDAVQMPRIIVGARLAETRPLATAASDEDLLAAVSDATRNEHARLLTLDHEAIDILLATGYEDVPDQTPKAVLAGVVVSSNPSRTPIDIERVEACGPDGQAGNVMRLSTGQWWISLANATTRIEVLVVAGGREHRFVIELVEAQP